jgi:hypothetical protein
VNAFAACSDALILHAAQRRPLPPNKSRRRRGGNCAALVDITAHPTARTRLFPSNVRVSAARHLERCGRSAWPQYRRLSSRNVGPVGYLLSNATAMMLVYFLGLWCLLCALVFFLFALLTWRRTLARQAGMLALAGSVMVMLLSGAAHLWLTVLSVLVAIVVLVALVAQDRQPRRRDRQSSSNPPAH